MLAYPAVGLVLPHGREDLFVGGVIRRYGFSHIVTEDRRFHPEVAEPPLLLPMEPQKASLYVGIRVGMRPLVRG